MAFSQLGKSPRIVRAIARGRLPRLVGLQRQSGELLQIEARALRGGELHHRILRIKRYLWGPLTPKPCTTPEIQLLGQISKATHANGRG